MSVSSTVPSERKKLVWQSSWQVKAFSSVSTRQQGTQGVGATPWGITCTGWGKGVCVKVWHEGASSPQGASWGSPPGSGENCLLHPCQTSPLPSAAPCRLGCAPKGFQAKRGGRCTRAWGPVPGSPLWRQPGRSTASSLPYLPRSRHSAPGRAGPSGSPGRSGAGRWCWSAGIPHTARHWERGGRDGGQRDGLASASLKTASVCPPCAARHVTPFPRKHLFPICDIPCGCSKDALRLRTPW